MEVLLTDSSNISFWDLEYRQLSIDVWQNMIILSLLT